MVQKKSPKTNKPNEYVSLLFDQQGIPIDSSDLLLFPKREAVFAAVSKIHRAVFFPLCSINIQLIHPDWDFYGHFVYVFREEEENVQFSKYFTPYCGDYSLGFDCVDGLYDLQAKVEMLSI